MKHHLILIENDLFNIEKRLKKINKNFIVYFNTIKKEFELYSNRFNKNIFEISLGKNLTSKAIGLIEKNRVENLSKIIFEMDKQNEKLEKEAQNKSNDLSKQILKEMLSFADKKNNDVDFSKEKIL